MSSKHDLQQFQINGMPTGENFSSFCEWAFSNMDVPFIRGVAIEYLLVQHLLKHADKIAADRVEAVTPERPKEGQLAASAARSFGKQIHGDVFDLQIHWGVTFEFKTTASKDTWRLHKTQRWNVYSRRSVSEWVYPAQYYVLAELDRGSITNDASSINFDGVKFYARSGRSLDAFPTESVSFMQFTNGIEACFFEGLSQVLHDLLEVEYEVVKVKMKDANRWSTGTPNRLFNGGEVIPFFLEGRSGRRPVWLQQSGTGWETVGLMMSDLWRADAEIGWRDWETAGLKYDNSLPAE
jgi:hypothetical protein